MLDHLSNYPSPNLPEAVSEVNKSIQLLNEPKKIFLFKDSYISEKIENYIKKDGILNCSYAGWICQQSQLSKQIFEDLQHVQTEKYLEIISFWILAILKRNDSKYDWSDIYPLIITFMNYDYCPNTKRFPKSTDTSSE